MIPREGATGIERNQESISWLVIVATIWPVELFGELRSSGCVCRLDAAPNSVCLLRWRGLRRVASPCTTSRSLSSGRRNVQRRRDGPAERSQLLDCVLRQDSQRSWKLRVLDAVALALSVLECGERIGRVFAFKKTSACVFRLHDSSPRSAIADDSCRSILMNLDLALSHGLPLPLCCRKNKLFRVFIRF